MRMSRRHRRAFAAVCVIATIAGTAYAQLAVTPNTAHTNSGSIPENTPGRVVFSIRNTSQASVDITGFSNGGGTECGDLTISPATATLTPNQQMQFVASTTNGFPAGTHLCGWTITTNPPSAAFLSTQFQTALVASPADVQPPLIDFGSQFIGNTETQDVTVSSYYSGGNGYAMLSDTTGRFQFDQSFCGAGNQYMCPLNIPTSGGQLQIPVICNPAIIAGGSAFVNVYSMGTLPLAGSGSGATLLGQVTLQNCVGGNAIQFENAPIAIITMPATAGSGSAHIISLSGSGTLDGAMLTTGDPSFKITDCNGTTCNFGMPGRTLPTYLTVECVGGSFQTSAQLTVYGSGVGSDTGTITCVAMGTTGSLTASPNPLAIEQVDVGSTSLPNKFTLFNSGGSPVTGVTVSAPSTNPNDWTVSGCPASAPCTVNAGSSQDISVSFHPTTYGPLDTSVTVSASGPIVPFPVQLQGDGMAGEMRITAPPSPYVLDFGTIPRGQAFTRTLSVSNVGNKTFTVNGISTSSPYSIAPMVSQLLTPQSQQSYTVTCQSSTASASNDQTLAITSDAHFNPNANVSLKCSIADTAIQVMPQQFDFGEVRTGTPTRELMVTITNPAAAGAAAHITGISLREPRTGLSLMPAMTDRQLQPGESVSATLVLTTEEDSELDGELIDIFVDTTMLALPVTGKVVTATSSLVPAQIDLGTACVGSLVGMDVELTNEGTATLQVEQPTFDMSFNASVPGNMTFPTPLQPGPGAKLTATVEPIVTTAGKVNGTLTWDDDVPSHYQVPTKVEYITSGTALSPALIDFGSIAVDAAGFPKHVNIENCDLQSTDITIKAIRTQGSPVGAWVLEPRLGTKKTLQPHEHQAITVTFRPPARGRYEADLEVETSVGPKTIHLRGDAVGRDFDNTSFYACACTSLSPSRGWPIVVAIFFVIFRRRRAPSSPR
jgi:hypothetical protein